MGSAVSAHSSGNTKLPQDKLLQWRADHAAREAESQLYVAMCRDLNAQWTEEDSAAVVPVEQPPGERVSTAVDEREDVFVDGTAGGTIDDTAAGRAGGKSEDRRAGQALTETAQMQREQRVMRRTALYGDYLDGALDKTRFTVALSQVDAWRLSATPPVFICNRLD